MITIFNINKIHGIKANCRRAGVFRRELCNAYRKSQVQDDTKQTPEQCYLSVPEKPLWEYARTRGERSFRLFILHSMKKKREVLSFGCRGTSGQSCARPSCSCRLSWSAGISSRFLIKHEGLPIIFLIRIVVACRCRWTV